MKSPIMYWDEETGVSQCVITANDGSIHIGKAVCAPQDRDMLSEKTGAAIAEMRANIAYLRHSRDYSIKPELKSLKRFWNTINCSKYYDANSYPVQMLLRSIQRYENDLTTINEEIAELKENLKTYMTQKGIFYQKVREYRKNNTKAEDK